MPLHSSCPKYECVAPGGDDQVVVAQPVARDRAPVAVPPDRSARRWRAARGGGPVCAGSSESARRYPLATVRRSPPGTEGAEIRGGCGDRRSSPRTGPCAAGAPRQGRQTRRQQSQLGGERPSSSILRGACRKPGVAPPESTVTTACPLDCPDACTLTVTVRGGRVTKIDGATENHITNGYICAKVRRFPERVYGEDRLLYPAHAARREGRRAVQARDLG